MKWNKKKQNLNINDIQPIFNTQPNWLDRNAIKVIGSLKSFQREIIRNI